MPKLTYELEIIKDGKVIKKIEDTSKSFVSNFATLIRWLIQTTNQYLNLKHDGGSVVSISQYSYVMYVNYYGGRIAVGSGSTPPSPTDYKLVNEIERKTAVVENLIIEADKSKFSMYADFSFTEDKTIQEFGIYINPREVYWCLIVRDVLSEPIVLPAGATLRVRYNWIFPI